MQVSWLAACCLSAIPLAAAARAPLAVSLLQLDGAAVQLRLSMPATPAPTLEIDTAPSRVVLVWAGELALARPLPVLPADEALPLQEISLKHTGGNARLEFRLSKPARPSLRRVGDSWVLRLEPEAEAAPVLPARRTPQGADKAAARRQAAGRPEQLLLEVTINGQRLAGVARTEQLPGQSLLLSRETWTEARLAPLAQIQAFSDRTPAFALDAVAGLSYQINREKLTLSINAPASAFVGSELGLRTALTPTPPPPAPGLLVNYDMSFSGGNGASPSAGAAVEAVAFSRFGTVVTSALVRNGTRKRPFERLDTYWRYPMPGRLETLVVGDAVGSAGGWSRSARFGGVRWARDFGLQPRLVTLPMVSLSGEAALPSTVELLVNNARQLSQSMAPGPFDLTNIPVTTGAGQVSLVVRDLLGRQTVIEQNYYMSSRLLAPGLTDFSLEAGRLRTGFGDESQYREWFGAATVRAGLTPILTGEMRAELQAQRRAVGAELVGVLAGAAVAKIAGAISQGSINSPGERGHLLQAAIERSTAAGGATLQYERYSKEFSQFAETPFSAARRPRERWIASGGGAVSDTVSAGVNFVQQTLWNGERLRSAGASANIPVYRNTHLIMTVNKRLDANGAWSAAAGVNFPIAPGVQSAARIDATPGHLDASVSAEKSAPAGPGMGWRVDASTQASRRARAGLQYNTNQAEWSLDAAASADGRMFTRAGARGSLGLLAGIPFAARPVGNGSFAMVEVKDVAGVPISLSHQVVATTDARGLAFVAGLLPWQYNQIEIDVADLPLDVSVSDPVRQILPFAQSGAKATFDVRRSRQASLILHQRSGAPVPVGARVRLLPQGQEFVVGRRGRAWLTDLAADRQRIEVTWTQGGCTLDLAVARSGDGAPAIIGPLACGNE